MTIPLRSAILLPLLLGGLGLPVGAAGFQLREQSPSAQGNAFAGVSAGGTDISSMSFNPATMTRFPGNEVVAGFSLVAPRTRLRDASATSVLGDYPAGGSSSYGNAGNTAVLPNLYAMWSLSPGLKLGFSVNAPFGMGTSYDSGFIGRYHALKSELQVIDLAPSMAYRISPRCSLGAAFVARRTRAELSNAVDFGTILTLNGVSTAPGSQDGSALLEGSTWSYGYKLGLNWEPAPAFRLGLGYQSASRGRIQGDASFQGVPSALATSFTDSRISATVNLPSTLSLGWAWELSKGLTLQGEAARTEWSSFRELRVDFLDNPLPDAITEEHWRDTWFLALGATWQVSEAWTLRAGLAYDQAATDDVYRTPRIPDTDRTWVSAGIGYAFSRNLSLDVAMTHIFCREGDLDLKAIPEGTTLITSPNTAKGDLGGTYRNRIDILAASLRCTF